jgi:hypothetical protein
VAQQSWLDVLREQRLTQQRVALQIDLTDGQVVVGSPPGVELLEFRLGQVGQSVHHDC